jgi:uncharacterized protein (TIGR02118 family)
MVVIYRTPADVEAFDKHYVDVHVPLTKKLPGLRSYEVSTGPVRVLTGGADVYRVGVLHFDDMAAISAAFASPEGAAAAADRRVLAGDSDVQILLFDSEVL